MKPISKKDKAMVQMYVSDPKTSKTDAYIKTHNVRPDTKLSSLYTQAVDTFKKPEVRTELAKYNNRVEQVLIDTIDEWGNHHKPRHREIAIDTAKFVHDKIHGKATQRTEVNSTTVNLNLDLTSITDSAD